MHPRHNGGIMTHPIPARITPLLILVVMLAGSLALAQQGDVRRVHDPCIIAADGAYYVFCTGGGIASRRSKDLVHWERIGAVFRALPAWTGAEVPGVRGLWAPDISYFNGRYHLYYAVSTFGQNRSCIGLAVNATLDPANPDYKWVDLGKVIESRQGDAFNAIDANIVFDEQKQPWMAFGSFWSGIKLIRIDPSTGKPPADARMQALLECLSSARFRKDLGAMTGYRTAKTGATVPTEPA